MLLSETVLPVLIPTSLHPLVIPTFHPRVTTSTMVMETTDMDKEDQDKMEMEMVVMDTFVQNNHLFVRSWISS